jgi:hypothetical protein
MLKDRRTKRQMGQAMMTKKLTIALLASSALVGPAILDAALAADMLVKAPERAAVTPISGYLEMEGGFAWNENRGNNPLQQLMRSDPGYGVFSGSDRKWMFNGAGRVNWWIGPNLSTQFDVWGGVDSFGRGHNSGNLGVIANSNLGGHFSYRQPEQYLVGFFGAIGGIGSNANCCQGGAGFTHGTVGLEGQWYSGPITLYGQGGVQANLSDVNDGGNYTAWFVRVVGRYFLNDNLRLEAFGMYAQGRSSSEDFAPTGFIFAADRFDMTHFVWGASIEKKLDGSPLALFARYEGAWTEFRTSFDTGYTGPTDQYNRGHTMENAFKVGFRLYLNEQTLKYNDRMGTTLDIRDAFTSAYRAFGRTWNSNNAPL